MSVPTFDFMSGALPVGSELKRNSPGTRFNASTALVNEAVDVPRFDYDPALARTNFVANNTFVGAVPGTVGAGGIIPVGWAISTNGLAIDVSLPPLSETDGVDCIDLRFYGTPTSVSGLSINTETAAASVAVIGEQWTVSGSFALVGGDLTNVNGMSIRPGVESAGPVNLTATLARRSQSRTLTTSSARWTLRSTYLNTTTPVDFTLRLGLPQRERGLAATDPIRTNNTGAVTIAPLRGLLVEPTRTNIFSRSRDISNAAWGKSQVVTSGAFGVVENTVTAGHYLGRTPPEQLQIGESRTYSAIVSERAGSAKRYFSFVALGGGAIPVNATVAFDIGVGAISRIAQPSTAIAAIESAGLGKWLCSITVTAVAVGGTSFQARLNNAATSTTATYVGDGTSGFDITDLQAESSSRPTSRIISDASSATREADQLKLFWGLLGVADGDAFVRLYFASGTTQILPISIVGGQHTLNPELFNEYALQKIEYLAKPSTPAEREAKATALSREVVQSDLSRVIVVQGV